MDIKQMKQDIKQLQLAIENLKAVKDSEEKLFYKLKIRYGANSELGNRAALIDMMKIKLADEVLK